MNEVTAIQKACPNLNYGNMQKITSIIISVLFLECFCLGTMAQSNKKAVIVMLENSSGNILGMEIDETLDNIDSNLFYIDKGVS